MKKNDIELFIETDRLRDVQRSIERFLEKWTKKRLAELEVPWQIEKQKKTINFFRWANRFVAVGSGVLSLIGYPRLGGVIGIFCPLIEAFCWGLKDKNDDKRKKWGELVEDSERLGNDFDKLAAAIESVKNFSLEKFKKTLESLGEKMYNFLREYDKNQDKRIDISELKIDQFALDLKQKWESNNKKTKKVGKGKILKKIVWEIQNLQKEVANYRYGL